MRARAVIGANWGDEGKGLMTDYICAMEGADVVVRFNGGAQAGHTVVTPQGMRHVFSHIGSGTLLGVPTYLSDFFVVNPLLFIKEWAEIPRVSGVYVHPSCIVTTPMDMILNQARAKQTGHGSVGVGINETMRRSRYGEFLITVRDMHRRDLFDKVRTEYFPAQVEALGLDLKYDENWTEIYFRAVETFLHFTRQTQNLPGKFPVFEGAQGLMLDQNSDDYPHVTHSNTGLFNVRALCARWNIPNLVATYVTRSYFTRHGAGPLPNEEPCPGWMEDNTNVPHEFQGTIRYAPIDVLALERRILKDVGGAAAFNVAVTHMDQYALDLKRFFLPVERVSYGPTRVNVVKPHKG